LATKKAMLMNCLARNSRIFTAKQVQAQITSSCMILLHRYKSDVGIYKHNKHKIWFLREFIYFGKRNKWEELSQLGVALPSGCRYTVQVPAPVAAIVAVLALEKHRQGDHVPN